MDDHKGHIIKDSIKDNKLELFDTENIVFILKKTEKLSAALYRVTESISDQDPLKYKSRTIALDILSDVIIAVRGNIFFSSANVLDSVLLNILKIISMLEVSFVGSIVSKMNFSILQEEYMSLREVLIRYQEKRYPPISTEVSQDESGKEASKYMLSTEKTSIFKGPVFETKKEKRREKVTNVHEPHSPRSSEDKEKRRSIIMDFIKDNGEVSIKDILKDQYLSEHYSEKTIQRELVELVNRDMLKKRGERRWSKYHL